MNEQRTIDRTAALDEVVTSILEEAGLATAVTVVADTPDGRIERAYGTRYDGAPAALTDLVPLYCTAKPVLALAFLGLAEERGVSVDAPLSSELPWLAGHWIGEHTFADLLGHRTTLYRLGGLLPMATEPGARGELLRHLPAPSEEDGIGYADFGAWYLLGQAVEHWTRRDFREVAFERVLRPYGLTLRDLNLGIPPAVFDQWQQDIAINLYRREETGLHPLVAEGCAIWACEWNPAFTGYGTVPGLVAFYRAVLADRAGAGVAFSQPVAAAATTAGERFFDVRLDHDSRYGLGFMTDMELFRCGPAASPRSFGQSGVGAGSLAFADPDHDLAVAIVVNAVFDETLDLMERRPDLVAAVYRDLGLPVEATR